MYNQTNLQIKPSYSLAAICASPFLAALYIAINLEIPLFLQLALSALICLAATDLILRTCILAISSSIIGITITEKDIITYSKRNTVTRANILQSKVFPWLCIVVAKLDKDADCRLLSDILKRNTELILISPLNNNSPTEYRRARCLLNMAHTKK